MSIVDTPYGNVDIRLCLADGYPLYTLTHRVENGDVVQMMISPISDDPTIVPMCDYTWWVMLYVGPRKRKETYNDGVQTGRCGLTGLHVALRILAYFIGNCTVPGQRVMLNGSDSRRFKIYKHYLSRYGFRETRYNGTRVMSYKVQ